MMESAGVSNIPRSRKCKHQAACAAADPESAKVRAHEPRRRAEGEERCAGRLKDGVYYAAPNVPNS